MNWTKEKKANLVAILRGYRELKGLSRFNMASNVGIITDRTLERWESGKSLPSNMACDYIARWAVEEAKICSWEMMRDDTE